MKLIIDIPEDMFEWFKNGEIIDEYDKSALKQVFKNGTPLPKGHGKIIDVNEAINYIDDYAFGFFSFDDVPAIIEADTESEDQE